MTRRIAPPYRDEPPVLWRYVALLAVVAILLVLASCKTYEAVTTTPVEVWIGLERILVALCEDFYSILELLL